MARQVRYTKNVKVAMYLIECEHEAELVAGEPEVYCHTCRDIIPPRFVGNISVSLDKDGFLTAKAPLRVKEPAPPAIVSAQSKWPGE